MSELLQQYTAGLEQRDFKGVPFTSDVIFEGIMDQTDNRDDFLALCEGFFGMVSAVRVHRSFGDERGGVVVYEFDTPAGTIPIVDVLDFRDGAISKMKPHFNPAPLAALRAQA